MEGATARIPGAYRATVSVNKMVGAAEKTASALTVEIHIAKLHQTKSRSRDLKTCLKMSKCKKLDPLTHM